MDVNYTPDQRRSDNGRGAGRGEVDRGLTRFGPFIMVRPLGRGGMGEVYVARTPWDTNRVAAVKRLRPDVARVPTFAERFKHEADVAVRLEHANVVGTIDVGSVDGQIYVASDLVLGKDTGVIADRLRERGQGAPVAVVVRLLLDILDGLAYVHGAREPDGRWLALLHRDVTPGNVLVGYDGVARLADFGLAKSSLTEAAHLTGHGEILGTPHYLAPEVIRGEKAEKGADIYGLGAVMYRVLTGVAPYQGTTAEVLFKALGEKPRPLLEWRPDLPPWFAAFVEEMLEGDPKKRPFDAALLRRRLEHEANAGKVLLPAASVGRWLGQLFDQERSQEVEEYEAIAALDPQGIPGFGQGTVVLAHAYKDAALEAPPPVPSGVDLENLGTELDLNGNRESAGDLAHRLFLDRGGDSETHLRTDSGDSSFPDSFSGELDAMPTYAAALAIEPSASLPDIGRSSFAQGSPGENTAPNPDLDEETRPVNEADRKRLEARTGGLGVDSTEEGKRGPMIRPLPGFADGKWSDKPIEEVKTAVTDLEINKRDRVLPKPVIEDAPRSVRAYEDPAKKRPEDPSPRPKEVAVIVPALGSPAPRPALAVGLPRPTEARPSQPVVAPVDPKRLSPALQPKPLDLREPKVPDPARTDERIKTADVKKSQLFPVLGAVLAAAIAIGVGIAIGLWLSSMREPAVIEVQDAAIAARFRVVNEAITERTKRGDPIPAEVPRLLSDAANALLAKDMVKASELIEQLERALAVPKAVSAN